MMAPAAEELSRTKLVADFVAALRATGSGHVTIEPLVLGSYESFHAVSPRAQHQLQRITFSRTRTHLDEEG